MSLTTVSPILNMPTYLPTYLPTHSFFCYLYPCSNDYSTIWMVTHSSRLRAQLVSCALSKSVNIPSILHPLPFSVQCSIYISLWILMKKQKQGLNFCSRKNRIKVIHMSGYTILNKCWTYHSQHAQMTNPPIHACLPFSLAQPRALNEGPSCSNVHSTLPWMSSTILFILMPSIIFILYPTFILSVKTYFLIIYIFHLTFNI